MTAKSNLNVDTSYFNFWIRNDQSVGSIPAFFLEDRRAPVLDRMEDFTVSVARFRIPGALIPLFIFEEGAYVISMAIGPNVAYTTDNTSNQFSNIYTRTVNYTAPGGFPVPDISPDNRFVYYYREMLDMINTTLDLLWADVLADPAYVGAIPRPIITATNFTTGPIIILDDKSAFLRIDIPQQDNGVLPNSVWVSPFGGNNASDRNSIHIFLSPKLFYFLSGFNSQFYQGGAGFSPLFVPLANHRLTFDYQTANKAFDVPESRFPAYRALPIYQDYSCLHLWQRLGRLLFTTSMPIASEDIGVNGLDGENFSQTILTDFEVLPNEAGTAREYIAFYPQGDLRVYNFTSNGELRKMSLRVYYQLQDLSLIPLQIPPGFEVTVKLEFKRRINGRLLTYGNSNTSINF